MSGSALQVDSPGNEPSELLILGGGLAGSAAALTAQSCGAHVTLVDRPRQRYLPEMVPSFTRRALMSLTRAAKLNTHLQSFGVVRVSWGTDAASGHLAMSDPDGSPLWIDRHSLAAELRRKIENQGAAVHRTTAVDLVRVRAGWAVTLDSGVILKAKRLLIAPGRRCSLGPQFNSRLLAEPLIAVAMEWAGPVSATAAPEMSLEPGPEGWWYKLTDTRNRCTLVFVTLPQFLSHRRSEDRAWLIQRIPRRLLEECVNTSYAHALTSIHVAHMQCRTRAAGPGWALAGDARIAVDPLSGAGVVRALEDGRRVAQYLLEDPDQHARTQFHIAHAEEFTELSRHRAKLYAQEQRFRDVFWRRAAQGFGSATDHCYNR